MKRISALLAPLLFLAVSGVTGHELEANRITLVQRDPTHLSATMFLSMADTLHQMIAPKQAFAEFAAIHSAMPLSEFERVYSRAKTQTQSETRLTASSSGAILLTNWKWPEASQAQVSLRQRFMQLTVDPAAHAHHQPMEVTFDGTSASEISGVRVTAPNAIQPLLIVAYKPRQVWLQRGGQPAEISFH